MSTTKFAEATRVSTSLLWDVERRCLLWLAARMPPGINSDHLTGLALFAMLMTGVSYWIARATPWGLFAAVLWLAVNWFGDSLDGTLARVRGQQRPRYGFYVDHIVDVFGMTLLMTGLALSGYMSPLIGMAFLVAYFLVSIEVYLATYCCGTFQLSFWKFGPTELRILLAVGSLALWWHPTAVVFGQTFRLFDVSGAIGAAALMVIVCVSAVRNVRVLYRAEPIPPRCAEPSKLSAMALGLQRTVSPEP